MNGYGQVISVIVGALAIIGTIVKASRDYSKLDTRVNVLEQRLDEVKDVMASMIEQQRSHEINVNIHVDPRRDDEAKKHLLDGMHGLQEQVNDIRKDLGSIRRAGWMKE